MFLKRYEKIQFIAYVNLIKKDENRPDSYILCLIPGWHKNNQSPRLSVSATIVANRENITHYNHANAGDLSGAHGFHSTSSTSYYVTFQVESGDRMELQVSGREYRLDESM